MVVIVIQHSREEGTSTYAHVHGLHIIATNPKPRGLALTLEEIGLNSVEYPNSITQLFHVLSYFLATNLY